ncbi:MAG TPA: hypothetical protein VGS27_03310 [Candidatus Sulfotelmatobacter sp.]|nr:hypothetical protein [Candidatus Sulfotelmatobacter sp.]
MSRWNVKTSTLIILSCLIAIMLLIVILPDVDLDDMAFHQGTAPLVVHARGTTALGAVVVAALLQLPGLMQISGSLLDFKGFALSLDPNFRPILLCAIRR